MPELDVGLPGSAGVRTIAKAVGKLYRAEGSAWLEIGIGALVWWANLDDARQYFKFVQLHDAAVLLDEELHMEFSVSYQTLRTTTGSHAFHTFELGQDVYGLCFSCGEEAATFASHASLSARESLPPPRAAPLPRAARMAPTARSGGGGGGLLSNIFGRKKDKDGGRVQNSPALPGQQLKTAPPAAAVAVTGRNGCGIAGGNPADTTTAGTRGVPRRYAPAAEPVPVLRHVGWDEELGFSTHNVPEEWKVLFKAAGIKPRDLQEWATAKVIVDALADNLTRAELDSMPPLPGVTDRHSKASVGVPYKRRQEQLLQHLERQQQPQQRASPPRESPPPPPLFGKPRQEPAHDRGPRDRQPPPPPPKSSVGKAEVQDHGAGPMREGPRGPSQPPGRAEPPPSPPRAPKPPPPPTLPLKPPPPPSVLGDALEVGSPGVGLGPESTPPLPLPQLSPQAGLVPPPPLAPRSWRNLHPSLTSVADPAASAPPSTPQLMAPPPLAPPPIVPPPMSAPSLSPPPLVPPPIAPPPLAPPPLSQSAIPPPPPPPPNIASTATPAVMPPSMPRSSSRPPPPRARKASLTPSLSPLGKAENAPPGRTPRGDEARSALLAQIQKGGNLRKVIAIEANPKDRKDAPRVGEVGSDIRAGLFDQIAKGAFNLKKVAPQDTNSSSKGSGVSFGAPKQGGMAGHRGQTVAPTAEAGGGLMGALGAALAARRLAQTFNPEATMSEAGDGAGSEWE